MAQEAAEAAFWVSLAASLAEDTGEEEEEEAATKQS